MQLEPQPKPKDREPITLTEAVAQAFFIFELVLKCPKDVDDPNLARVWIDTLAEAGIRPEEVIPAARRVLATAEFFPTPKHLIEAVHPKEDKEAAEELAWQRVLGAIRRCGIYASLTAADLAGDETALWALSRMGWVRLCEQLTEENRAIWRAEFIRLYRAGRVAGAKAGGVAGLHETRNGASQYALTPVAVGRPDWKALPGADRPAVAALEAGEGAEGAPATEEWRSLKAALAEAAAAHPGAGRARRERLDPDAEEERRAGMAAARAELAALRAAKGGAQ